MNRDAAHQKHWEIAEVVFGVPFLISVILQFIIPFSLPQGFLRLAFIPAGIVLITIGITVISLARRELSRFRQPTDPGHPTSKIVKTGVFSVSRNPMYLGSVVFLLGVAFTFNQLWAMVMLLPSVILCQYVLVLPEEHYLAAKFGDEYKEYMTSVHRWLGRK